MPLQKLRLKPGVNRENTRYTTEGGWFDCDKVRFRQGNPESIGGWQPLSTSTFQGVCRALFAWNTLDGTDNTAVGTNLKYYVERGGQYNDITPIRSTVTLGSNPFTGDGTTTVVVSATSHGALTGDFVTFSGVTGTYASLLNGEFQITVININSYSITVSSTIPAGTTGGSAVVAAYQLNVGVAFNVPLTGWGGGTWGAGTWGIGGTSTAALRWWTQQNYGEDLVFGPRGGGIYYWDASSGLTARGVNLNSLGGTVTFTTASPTVVTLTKILTEGTAVQFSVSSGGTLPTGISASTTYYLFNVAGLTANLLDSSGALVNVSGAGSGTFSISTLVDVPTTQNVIAVSDSSRFIFAFGANNYGDTALDPMLIRWSDQDNPLVWTPDATNQAGDVRLSFGSEIVGVVQTRQEIVALTDAAVYSLQYLGPPLVWGSQLMANNTSIVGSNAVTVASGVVYWMGTDKFYAYDGRVQTLNCDIRRYIFNDFNYEQKAQVYAGTNEGFNEVWWFYCSANSTYPDKYVVYNYLENVWYYGTMQRTAWLDSGLLEYPIATVYDSNAQTGRIVRHELGLNDNTGSGDTAIHAYISSSEFDIDDGQNFSFIWRVLPDITFSNSSNSEMGQPPRVTMTLRGLYNSGSGQIDSANGVVAKGSSYVITDEFTGQIFTRVRGRQLIFEIESNQINTAWQLGSPRLDIKPDGRR